MKKATKKQGWTVQKALPYILLITGFVALMASFILTLDHIQLIKDPSFVENFEYRVKPEEFVDYTIVSVKGLLGSVFTSTISELKHYYTSNNYQGYLKRTRFDGKVVSFEFISQ